MSKNRDDTTGISVGTEESRAASSDQCESPHFYKKRNALNPQPLDSPASDYEPDRIPGPDKDQEYPPIVTIDGRVDTDIDHLMDDLNEEPPGGALEEKQRRYPKPHVFSVIQGSIDDDVDSLANHDGTMEHTLVDAPKNFHVGDLKDVHSRHHERQIPHKVLEDPNALSQTDRSHNKLSQEDEEANEVTGSALTLASEETFERFPSQDIVISKLANQEQSHESLHSREHSFKTLISNQARTASNESLSVRSNRDQVFGDAQSTQKPAGVETETSYVENAREKVKNKRDLGLTKPTSQFQECPVGKTSTPEVQSSAKETLAKEECDECLISDTKSDAKIDSFNTSMERLEKAGKSFKSEINPDSSEFKSEFLRHEVSTVTALLLEGSKNGLSNEAMKQKAHVENMDKTVDSILGKEREALTKTKPVGETREKELMPKPGGQMESTQKDSVTSMISTDTLQDRALLCHYVQMGKNMSGILEEKIKDFDDIPLATSEIGNYEKNCKKAEEIGKLKNSDKSLHGSLKVAMKVAKQSMSAALKVAEALTDAYDAARSSEPSHSADELMKIRKLIVDGEEPYIHGSRRQPRPNNRSAERSVVNTRRGYQNECSSYSATQNRRDDFFNREELYNNEVEQYSRDGYMVDDYDLVNYGDVDGRCWGQKNHEVKGSSVDRHRPRRKSEMLHYDGYLQRRYANDERYPLETQEDTTRIRKYHDQRVRSRTHETLLREPWYEKDRMDFQLQQSPKRYRTQSYSKSRRPSPPKERRTASTERVASPKAPGDMGECVVYCNVIEKSPLYEREYSGSTKLDRKQDKKGVARSKKNNRERKKESRKEKETEKETGKQDRKGKEKGKEKEKQKGKLKNEESGVNLQMSAEDWEFPKRQNNSVSKDRCFDHIAEKLKVKDNLPETVRLKRKNFDPVRAKVIGSSVDNYHVRESDYDSIGFNDNHSRELWLMKKYLKDMDALNHVDETMSSNDDCSCSYCLTHPTSLSKQPRITYTEDWNVQRHAAPRASSVSSKPHLPSKTELSTRERGTKDDPIDAPPISKPSTKSNHRARLVRFKNVSECSVSSKDTLVDYDNESDNLFSCDDSNGNNSNEIRTNERLDRIKPCVVLECWDVDVNNNNSKRSRDGHGTNTVLNVKTPGSFSLHSVKMRSNDLCQAKNWESHKHTDHRVLDKENKESNVPRNERSHDLRLATFLHGHGPGYLSSSTHDLLNDGDVNFNRMIEDEGEESEERVKDGEEESDDKEGSIGDDGDAENSKEEIEEKDDHVKEEKKEKKEVAVKENDEEEFIPPPYLLYSRERIASKLQRRPVPEPFIQHHRSPSRPGMSSWRQRVEEAKSPVERKLRNNWEEMRSRELFLDNKRLCDAVAKARRTGKVDSGLRPSTMGSSSTESSKQRIRNRVNQQMSIDRENRVIFKRLMERVKPHYDRMEQLQNYYTLSVRVARQAANRRLLNQPDRGIKKTKTYDAIKANILAKEQARALDAFCRCKGNKECQNQFARNKPSTTQHYSRSPK